VIRVVGRKVGAGAAADLPDSIICTTAFAAATPKPGLSCATVVSAAALLEPRAPARPPAKRPGLGRRLAKRAASLWTYAALIAVFAGSAFPVYWSFVVSSQTPDRVTRCPDR
jgi:hypothetical protein